MSSLNDDISMDEIPVPSSTPYPDPNSPTQILPINGVSFISNNQSVDGTNINGLKGNYTIQSSSSYSKETSPFFVFNGENANYWQCDISGNLNYDNLVSVYPKYTNNPYQLPPNDISPLIKKVDIENIYIGGGSIHNTWYTNLNDIEIKGEWIQIKLPQPIYLTRYDIMTPPYNGDETNTTFPKSFILLGSLDDGNKWSLVDRKVDIPPPSTNMVVQPQNEYQLQPTLPYSTYRLIITSMNKVDNIKITQWRLYGSLNIPISPIMMKETFMNFDCDVCNTNKKSNVFLNLNRGIDTMNFGSRNFETKQREPVIIINEKNVVQTNKPNKNTTSNEEHLANFILLNTSVIFIVGMIYLYKQQK